MLRPTLAVGTALTALLLSACGSSPDPASAPITTDPLAATSAAHPPETATPVDDAAPPGSPRPPAPAATPTTGPTRRATTAALTTATKAAPARATATRAAGAKPAPTAALSRPAGKKLPVELTGYSYHDNTPAGSPAVCCGVLHRTAGGKGTYADPITVAVAGSGRGMEFKPGTRFYLPKIRRYVIVEDSGASSGDNHLDVWVDGRDGSESATSACMDRITGDSTAELNPPPGRPVITGPIYSGGRCRLP